MDVKTQIYIRSNPNIYRYLREYSYWYKYLNRDSTVVKKLEQEMRERYKLTTKDRLEKLNQSMDLVNSFLNVLK